MKISNSVFNCLSNVVEEMYPPNFSHILSGNGAQKLGSPKEIPSWKKSVFPKYLHKEP